MTDKELLELAAKAAGIAPGEDGVYLRDNGWVWAPLDADGDAFRLAVKLGIFAGPSDFFLYWSVEQFGADLYAATRRAIVRAAAEIGKKTE